MACSLLLFPHLGRDFFPQVDAGQMRLHVRAPPASRLEETQRYFAEVEGAIRQIVGQDQVIEELLISLFSRGHCLLEGVPGLAKTLTVKTLADTLRARFQRIQFTPDLLPADIVGTTIYNMQTATFAGRS